MLVRVRVQIHSLPITDEDWEAIRSLAQNLTTERDRIEVTTDVEPGWLCVLFTMPTEPQYLAVPKIEKALKFCVYNRDQSTFQFPLTDEERLRADRKLEQARARRRAKRANQTTSDSGKPSTSVIRSRTT